MSLLVIGKFQGDTALFQRALVERSSEFEKVAERARADGGIHHRFGVGDGYVVIIDEWASLEQFQNFFGNPEIQAFIGSVGAAPLPPEIIIAEAVSSPDEY